MSTDDMWNAKHVVGGVEKERAIGNISRRSEVKICEEGQPCVEHAIQDPKTRRHCNSIEKITIMKLPVYKRLFY